MSPANKEYYLEQARLLYTNDSDIQIDDDARVIETEHGAWVTAWVLVDLIEEQPT